jgi:hypothetical protein
MVDEWEAQNIFTRSIASDILGIPTMEMVYCSFKSTINGWELPIILMVLGILFTKYKCWVNGRPKISSIGLLLKIFWAS